MHRSSFCVKPCRGFTSSQNCASYQWWCPKIGANGNWRKECVENICNFRCFCAISHSHMWKIKMFFFVKVKFQTQTSHQLWIIQGSSSFYVSVCFESGPILVCPPPTVGRVCVYLPSVHLPRRILYHLPHLFCVFCHAIFSTLAIRTSATPILKSESMQSIQQVGRRGHEGDDGWWAGRLGGGHQVCQVV